MPSPPELSTDDELRALIAEYPMVIAESKTLRIDTEELESMLAKLQATQARREAEKQAAVSKQMLALAKANEEKQLEAYKQKLASNRARKKKQTEAKNKIG
jgi:hypothetical protein